MVKRKIRITCLPVLSLETLISTVIDKKKYEFIPIDVCKKGITEKYGQKLFGEWCYPLKHALACFEEAVVKDRVKIIVSTSYNVCSYPMVLGNLKKWIEHDFDVYYLNIKKETTDIRFLIDILVKLSKLTKKNPLKILSYTPKIFKRLRLIEKLRRTYIKHLPLVKNQLLLRKQYKETLYKFYNTDSMGISKRLVADFEKECKRKKVKEQAKYRLLVTGDLTVMSSEFPLFDLNMHLAQQDVEVINPESNYFDLAYLSEVGKKTKKLLIESFRDQENSNNTCKFHIVEGKYLNHVVKGMKMNIDGVIFIKPIMCTPSEIVSHIVRKSKEFHKPIVEISYDEHSGKNGIVTRLEAFINIIEENNAKKGKSKKKPLTKKEIKAEKKQQKKKLRKQKKQDRKEKKQLKKEQKKSHK